MFNNLEMVLNIAQYFLNNVQYFDFNRGKKRQNRTFWLQSGKKASKNRKIPGRVVDLKCWILKSSLPQRYESTSRSTCFPRCSSSRRHKDCSVDLVFFRRCRRSVKQSPKTWPSMDLGAVLEWHLKHLGWLKQMLRWWITFIYSIIEKRWHRPLYIVR